MAQITKNKVYLEHVSATSSKFYAMEELGNGTWRATWGKIGTRGQYPITYAYTEWSKKYNEKVYDKGYKEITPIPQRALGYFSHAPIIVDQAITDMVKSKLEKLIKVCKQKKRPMEEANAIGMLIRYGQTGMISKEDMIEVNRIFSTVSK